MVNRVFVTKMSSPTRQSSMRSVNGFNAQDYERPGLRQEEIVELKAAFDLFDTDSSGEICLAELEAAMKSLGYEYHGSF